MPFFHQDDGNSSLSYLGQYLIKPQQKNFEHGIKTIPLPLCESRTRNRWCFRHAGRDPEYPGSPETDTLTSSTISLQMDRLEFGLASGIC
ncbi:hypothetical protein QQF64_008405 [Cirrhinus molitorella]|uniref:Uncharacterized protein n=1 Tax=Cirrhinus molitorella TaxID=172907 RepID=A0ABR3M622_9TELE